MRRRASASRPAASAARWNAKTNAEAGRTARARGAAPWLAALLLGGLFLAGPAGADPDAARSQPLPEGEAAEPLPEGEPSQELPENGSQAEPLPDDAPPARRDDRAAEKRDFAAERLVWEAKREGVEDALRGVRLELGEAREARAGSCPTPEAEGCEELRVRVHRLESQERALASYLETGLLAECLRTECDRDWLGD